MLVAIVTQRGQLQAFGTVWGVAYVVRELRQLSRNARTREPQPMIDEEHQHEMPRVDDGRVLQGPIPPARHRAFNPSGQPTADALTIPEPASAPAIVVIGDATNGTARTAYTNASS